MNDDLHRHLDGDLPLEGLGDEVRGEAQAWERLLKAFREENPAEPSLPWLEARVMAEIKSSPEPGMLRRLTSWLLRPRAVPVSPLMAGVAVAALATVFFLGWSRGVPVSPGEATGPSLATPAGLDRAPGEAVVLVQFVLDAPGAISVAVAGDFDGWEGSSLLSDPDGDGVWSGRIPVKPGVHAYMFLVDGSTWITDPQAERYAEDGFGNRNAILAVTAPAA